jgi:cytoskeletal protein RodZ
MAIWPFNKKQKIDESLLPDEVSEYYKGGKNQKRGSWLLALGTMLVTAFLAVVLFFAGRWVFQTIFDNDDEDTQTTEQASDNQVEVKVTEPTANTDDSTNNSTNSDTDSTSDSQSDSDTSTSTSDNSTVNEQQTPTTGGINEIPDTGPGDGGLQ